MALKNYILGILQTDQVRDEFIDEFGDYPNMFTTLLADADAQYQVIDVRNPPLPDPAACDGYVITGSRDSVYDDLPWIPALIDFLEKAIEQQRKVVGICFGHQLLAHYFGGRVAPHPQGWAVGVHTSDIVAHHSWMQPPSDRLALLSSHKDQVIQLPVDAQLIATNAFCPNAGFVMGESVMTIQGHPEFSHGYAGALMKGRRDLIGEGVYRSGLESLDRCTDSERFAQWIWNFLRT